MQLVSKLSVKTAIGKVPMQNVEIIVDGQKETVKRGIEQPLMRVVGKSDRYKTGNSNFGEFIEFHGSFQATNILTGEVYRSGKLFLPDVAGNLMRGQHDASDGSIEFAFDIGVKPSDVPHGYEYTVTPLIAPSEADPLEALQARLLKDAPALPAPKKAQADLLDAPTEEVADAPKGNKKK